MAGVGARVGAGVRVRVGAGVNVRWLVQMFDIHTDRVLEPLPIGLCIFHTQLSCHVTPLI